MIGTAVPKRSAEQIVREAAIDFDAFWAARAEAEVKPARGEILVAATDCKAIPMVKPLGAQKVVRQGKGEKANPKEVLDSLFETGEQPERPKRTRPNHLQHRVISAFNGVTLVLDLLHVLEKLWKAAHALHPDRSREAETFVYHRAEGSSTARSAKTNSAYTAKTPGRSF